MHINEIKRLSLIEKLIFENFKRNKKSKVRSLKFPNLAQVRLQ